MNCKVEHVDTSADGASSESELVTPAPSTYQPMPGPSYQSWWPLVGGVLLMVVLLGGTLAFSLLGDGQPQPTPSPATSSTAP